MQKEIVRSSGIYLRYVNRVENYQLFGYNYIPNKAYIIVAGLTGLIAAMILTKLIKRYEWLDFNNLLWIDYVFYKIFNDCIIKKRNVQW